MKVIYFTHYSDLYGANKSLLEVIQNMKEKYNVEPIVISSGRGSFNEKLEEMNIENYNFNYLYCMDSIKNNRFKSVLKFIRYKIYNFIELNKLIRLFKNEYISVIHTNSSCIDIGSILAKKLKVKHIWHIREFGEEDYNIRFYSKIEKMSEFMSQNSERVICISKAIQEKYSPYFRDSEKLKVIYNGIRESDYFVNIREKNFNGNFKIAFTGLICKEKNQIELVRAMDILINERGIKDINVYILGDGNEEYINEINNFCIEKSIQKNIHFEGRVENVKKYIKDCSIGVISSYKEAFGRVTIEYMIGGLAVIASNTGANVEIITNDQDGLIYELGNIEELADKIENLYRDRDRLKMISIQGQNTATEKFTADINCKKIYEMYTR